MFSEFYIVHYISIAIAAAVVAYILLAIYSYAKYQQPDYSALIPGTKEYNLVSILLVSRALKQFIAKKKPDWLGKVIVHTTNRRILVCFRKKRCCLLVRSNDMAVQVIWHQGQDSVDIISKSKVLVNSTTSLESPKSLQVLFVEYNKLPQISDSEVQDSACSVFIELVGKIQLYLPD